MRMQWIPMIAVIIINLGIDVAIWRWLKRQRACRQWLKWAHAVAAAAMLALIAVALSLPARTVSNHTFVVIMWMIYTYLGLCIPRFVTVLLWQTGRLCRHGSTARKATHAVSAIAGLLVLAAMWWGALVTPHRVNVERVTVKSAKLPANFDGFRIVQISDLHLGTYGTDTSAVKTFVDSVNALKPDMVCFTGDLVSRRTSEAEPFRHLLAQLHAPYGVLSILGNHDYDDYSTWPTESQKMADRKALVDFERSVGWHLLKNETATVGINGDTIDVIGAENFGDPPFPTYGSLKATRNNLHNGRFKILLQHNPFEWRAEIAGKTPVDLTLSGHTHAMQIMLTVMGHRLSPACLRYREWGGRYDEGSQTLYVNIGLGMVGMPMRIGATPEITVITLKR